MALGTYGPPRELDIGRCFNEAIEVYKKNFLPLFLAAILFDVLSVLTLLVLSGPLAGGICLMTLKALRQRDRAVELGDLFGTFGKFLPLLELFFLTFVLELVGLGCLVLPGLFLMTIWLYPFYLMIDQEFGVFASLGASKDIVFRNGFWKNGGLLLIVVALHLAPQLVPGVGIVLAWFVAPVSWLIVASAYLQQIPAAESGLGDLREAMQASE